MNPKHLARRFLAVTSSLLAMAGSLSAQNPDLMLTPEQRDSVLSNHDNIVPLPNRQAIERGFDLPKLLGANLDVGKRWSFRTEVGLIGRHSLLLHAVHRLDL